MVKLSHTPGPWTVEEYGDDETPALVIHKDTESRVCFMATPGSYGDPATIEADAYLIAAAPDMLAALQELEAFVGVMVGKGPEAIIPETVVTPIGVPVKVRAIMQNTRAAIAKATTSN